MLAEKFFLLLEMLEKPYLLGWRPAREEHIAARSATAMREMRPLGRSSIGMNQGPLPIKAGRRS